MAPENSAIDQMKSQHISSVSPTLFNYDFGPATLVQSPNPYTAPFSSTSGPSFPEPGPSSSDVTHQPDDPAIIFSFDSAQLQTGQVAPLSDSNCHLSSRLNPIILHILAHKKITNFISRPSRHFFNSFCPTFLNPFYQPLNLVAVSVRMAMG